MADIATLGIKVETKGVEAGTRALDQLSKGARTAETAVKQMEVGAKNASGAAQRLAQPMSAAGRSAEQTARQMRMLAVQMPDVVSGVLSGQSAFQLLVQQGGQVYQQFQMGPGGVGGALRNVGGALRSLVTPSRVLGVTMVGGAVAAAAAWNKFDDQLKAVQRSLNTLGRGTGATSTSLLNAASMAAGTGRQSFGQAIGGASMFAGAGVSNSVIGQLLLSARTMSGATGSSLGDTQAFLADAFSDPIKGVGKLTAVFGPLSLETEKQIRLLQSSNKITEAQELLLRALNKKLKDTTDTTGYLQRAFESITSFASRIGMAIGKIGAKLTPAEELAAARNDLAYARKTFNNPEVIAEKMEKVRLAQKAVADEAEKAEQKRLEMERLRQQRIDEENRKIVGMAQADASLITARTSSERLAAQVERIRLEATFDTTRAVTAAADAERARTLAIAEATKALRDHQKSLRDEFFMSGALTEAERIRRRTRIEFRDIGRQTDVLNGGAAVASQPVAVATKAIANGLNPVFSSLLAKLEAAFPGARRTSGFRSHEEQAALRAKYGSGAARPGTSRHEIGVAADYSGRSLSADERAQFIAYARSLGLEVLPSNHGALHVQGPRSMASSKSVLGVPATGGARPLTVGAAQITEGDAVSRRINAVAMQILHDAKTAVEGQTEALKTSIATVGQSTYAIARQAEKQKLENDIRSRGIAITDEMAKKISEVADKEGKRAAAMEAFNTAQQKTISQLDDMRSSLSDAISSPLRALAEGKKPGEALRQAGLRAAGRMIDGGANNISEMLLGPRGKAGGGLFGSLFGKNMMAANMQVQAGNVIVTGGIPGVGSLLGAGTGGPMNLAGATGGGMGILSLIGKLFGFANGGIMSSNGPLPLRKYAKGGIATSPQVAVFGEGRHNEAFVPLPDGHSIPVRFEQKRQAISAGRGAGPTFNMGGISLNLQGEPNNAAIDRMKAELAQAQAQQSKELRRDFGSMLQNWQNNYA